jgi:hypothetical protein
MSVTVGTFCVVPGEEAALALEADLEELPHAATPTAKRAAPTMAALRRRERDLRGIRGVILSVGIRKKAVWMD